MNERVLVTGSSGVLGRAVVNQLIAQGKLVRIMSRRPKTAAGRKNLEWAVADLQSGEGVDAALADTTAIVHCATAYAPGKEQTLAKNLVAAAEKSGVRHIVYISIVGVDTISYFYYRAKLESEHVFENSTVPHSILRATQFHDLVREVLAVAAKIPVMFLPRLQVQPIDVTDVARRLAELALGEPQGRAADIGGPQVRDVAELAQTYIERANLRRAIRTFRLPGKTFNAYLQGRHLAEGEPFGEISFERYLAERPEPTSTSYRITKNDG